MCFSSAIAAIDDRTYELGVLASPSLFVNTFQSGTCQACHESPLPFWCKQEAVACPTFGNSNERTDNMLPFDLAMPQEHAAHKLYTLPQKWHVARSWREEVLHSEMRPSNWHHVESMCRSHVSGGSYFVVAMVPCCARAEVTIPGSSTTAQTANIAFATGRTRIPATSLRGSPHRVHFEQ